MNLVMAREGMPCTSKSPLMMYVQCPMVYSISYTWSFYSDTVGVDPYSSGSHAVHTVKGYVGWSQPSSIQKHIVFLSHNARCSMTGRGEEWMMGMISPPRPIT